MFLPKSLDEAILWLDQHGVKGVTANDLLRLSVVGDFQICAPILQKAYSPTIAAKNDLERSKEGIYDFDIKKAQKEATKQLFGLYPLYKPTLFELDIKRTVNVQCVGDLQTKDMYFVNVDVSVDELRVTSEALESLLSRCEITDSQVMGLPISNAVIPAKALPSLQSSYKPRRSIGKLAIKAAIEIENSTDKKASAEQVLKLLQQWADNGDEPDTLVRSDKRAVIWLTGKRKENDYTLEACGKTLQNWDEGRE